MSLVCLPMTENSQSMALGAEIIGPDTIEMRHPSPSETIRIGRPTSQVEAGSMLKILRNMLSSATSTNGSHCAVGDRLRGLNRWHT